MNSTTLRLVLLVSCAHALVHVYELSLPSLELQIAAEYVGDPASTDQAVVTEGRRQMGMLANTWRLPFGFGALLAGLLIDRLGARKMLVLYLLGCSATCLVCSFPLPIMGLFVVMFLMGSFASIYHPAGLTLISRETELHSRARALGLHGIFGSAGIALAPFLVGMLGQFGAHWRQSYLMIAMPGLVLAALLTVSWRKPVDAQTTMKRTPEDEQGLWLAFGILTVLTILQGLVYAGFISFLTRYLSTSQWVASWAEGATENTGGRVALASSISAAVLGMGCLGQYLAGRYAKVDRLERQLLLVTAMNVPLLLWMSLAEGNYRVAAAATFSVVHFMHQPLYNSLVAVYTPIQLRSSCYGFSFAMSFGLGSFGATLVGFSATDRQAYQTLAAVAVCGSLAAVALWLRSVRDRRLAQLSQ